MQFLDRVLLYKEAVCVTDLHIGVEAGMEKQGYNVPSQTKKMLDELMGYSGKFLIIVGDVKHSVSRASKQENREVPAFLRLLKEKFGRVVICKGNHDGRIEQLTDAEVVKDFVYEGVGFTHGHRWPGKEVFDCHTIVMGHVHPAFTYRDHLNRVQRRQCWLIGTVKRKKLEREKGVKAKVKRVVVMPAFNKIFYGRRKHEFGVLTDFVTKTDVLLTDRTKVF